MLHTKSRGHRPTGSGGADFLKGFYNLWVWRPSESGDQDHLNKLRSRVLRSHHMKFEFNWPSGFRVVDV